MGERLQFIELVQRREVSVSEASRMFGVSRKTAHKWLNRAEEKGLEHGLEDQSRARQTQERFEGRAVELLLELRRAHPNWGPRTLRYWMEEHHPRLALPAASTVGDLLRREGLVLPRRRAPKPGTSPYQPSESTPTKPNDRWTIDFKGEFRLGNGALCYPLTLRDAVSRMVLRIDARPNTRGEGVFPSLKTAFEEYGLPHELHSDTGSPFGSNGLARLAPISVYALKLGIRPVFSRPAKPQDNGAHERMHRDLKAETTRPPSRNFVEQQKRFDAFRELFNEERPHHALDGKTPLSHWVSSPRKLPLEVAPPSYPKHWEVRGVGGAGTIHWRGHEVAITKALRGEPVGLEPIADGQWRVHFYALAIGLLDERREKPEILGLNRPGRAP